MNEKYVIGIDFGTDSCRAIAVNTITGKTPANHTVFYPRWKAGLYCDAGKSQYRQHPQDYVDSLEEAVKGLLKKLPDRTSENIIGIGIDTTGSTPCLTDKNGTPLALLPQFKDNPNAMFILWKDHTSVKEAEEINRLAHQWHTDYTSYSGGIYSSEWFWAKALHALREDAEIRKHAYSVIEHCDWIPALLTGNLKPESVKRGRCAAGHKGMHHKDWKGYPEQEFFSALDPLLNGYALRMSQETYTGDTSVGKLNEVWASRLGLTKGIAVAAGILDAHACAVGAGIKSNSMVKIVGTSTCDIIVAPKQEVGSKLIPGISGQVDGSVIPGLIGFEAGQSAFGDVYAWYKNLLGWPLEQLNSREAEVMKEHILDKLTIEAEKLPLTDDALIANDWFNGRRTPFADYRVKGGLVGLSLGTTPAHIFRSLVEATAFGSKAIMEHLMNEGVKITEVIAVGGISLKSPYVMQTLSDVMGVQITVSAAEQAGALGSAMLAAVASGAFNSVEDAQKVMVSKTTHTYQPDLSKKSYYDEKFGKYKEMSAFLHQLFNTH